VPELPEVETIARDLRPELEGRRLRLIHRSKLSLRRRWQEPWTKALEGRRVDSTTRRGKWLVFSLEGGLQLVFHMGMSGQLTVVPHSEPVQDHTHLIFALDKGQRELRFRDIRRFGSATLYPDAGTLQAFFQKSKLGPEPFQLDPVYWREQLKTTRRNLKAVLLDQQIVAGVGNIYADESLFEAKLYPPLLASDLTAAQANRLRVAIEAVLERAIEKRGSSIRNYVGGAGLQGGYQQEFRVYGQFEKPCPRCRKPIARIRLAGRATHYCPHCQKGRK
jgi:formamidopyrimidine-DNA glycosylase